jgi:hypothetical protein
MFKKGFNLMKIQLDKTGTAEALENLLTTAQADTEIQAILIMSCDANEFTKEKIDPILQKFNKPVFGGIFPEIIHQIDKLTKGTIVAGLTKSAEVYLIPNLSDMDADYEDIIDKKIADSLKTKTMFVFVDGLAHRISALIDSLFNIFGLEMNYIGGGAGSLSFVQKPVLFTNEGLMLDAAILALTEIESGVGVSHGWIDVEGPFKVTESDRNVIKTLDWKPAFKVYKEVVEKHSGKTFSDDNFFDIAKGYPFGISKLGAEKIVRDPLSLDENDCLVCVGEVPQNVFVHILTGNIDSLVNAAKKALSLAVESLKPDLSYKTTFFIDCVSRVLFLNKEFSKELLAVSDESVQLFGALTLGEIANNGKDYLEFYNKTSVIGVFE